MSSFPINLAQLVALFVESVTWGVQIVTFTQCVWALFEAAKYEGGRRRVNVTLLVWAIALFIWGTLDISFALYRNITAFIYYTGPGGAVEIFSEISNYVTVLRVRLPLLLTWHSTHTLVECLEFLGDPDRRHGLSA